MNTSLLEVSNISKLETYWTFRPKEEGRERQTRTGRHQKSDSVVCKTCLERSNLASSATILTVVTNVTTDTEHGHVKSPYS